MTNNCKVDFMNKEIHITKNFYKKSQYFGSREFEMMCQLENRLPHFELKYQFKDRPSNRQFYPSYEQMMKYIETMDRDAIDDFHKTLQIAKATGKGYNLVRRWFLDKYSPANDEAIAA